jgi:transposase
MKGVAMTGKPKDPRGPSKYSDATRVRAVRLVLENGEKFPTEAACARHVAAQAGMAVATLRRWVQEARAEAGEVEPWMDWKDRRIEQLERENAELEQTVEVLKAATTFFARECDPQTQPDRPQGLAPVSSASSSKPTGTGSESHRSAGR